MAVKKIDWKNVRERALWTFAEGFVTCISPISITIDVFLDTGHFKAWLFGALLSSVLGGVMGGVSALKTCILDIIKQHNEQYKEIEPDIDYFEDDSEFDDEDLEDVFPEESKEIDDDEGDAEE